MALLGSSIDPRLQLQDYSGIVNAAQMQAQGLASIGSQIEAAAQQYKQYKKEQQDTQKRVKAAANLADSISALVPELKGPLGATVAQLKDPNLTLADKDALAQSISNTLQLGIGVVAGKQDRALRQEEINFKRGMLQAETQAEKDLQAAKAIKEEEERRRTNLGDLAFAKGAIGTITNATPATKSLIVDLINRGEGTYARQALSAVKDFTQGTDRISDVNAQGQIVIIDKNTGETFPAWTREDVALATPEGGIGQAASMQTPPPDPNVISGAIRQGVNPEDVGRFDERGMPTRPAGATAEISELALLPPPPSAATPEQIRTAAGATPQAQPGRKPVMARVPASDELARLRADIAKQEMEQKTKYRKTAADVTFEQNASAALRFINQLSDAIKKYGTFEMVSPEGSAQLGQLPYQVAIAYAKTVDPSSVAREGEVSAAQKYLIPIGLGTRNETALKAAEAFKKDVEERVRQYKKSTGADISIEGIDKTTSDQEDEEPTVSGANSYFNQFKQPPAR